MAQGSSEAGMRRNGAGQVDMAGDAIRLDMENCQQVNHQNGVQDLMSQSTTHCNQQSLYSPLLNYKLID